MNSSKAIQNVLFPFFFYFAFCLFSPASAQVGSGLPRFRQPPQVRIIGTLLPLEEKKAEQFKTLTIHVKGKSWKLRVQEITR